jgi:hypothetical protein
MSPPDLAPRQTRLATLVSWAVVPAIVLCALAALDLLRRVLAALLDSPPLSALAGDGSAFTIARVGFGAAALALAGLLAAFSTTSNVARVGSAIVAGAFAAIHVFVALGFFVVLTTLREAPGYGSEVSTFVATFLILEGTKGVIVGAALACSALALLSRRRWRPTHGLAIVGWANAIVAIGAASGYRVIATEAMWGVPFTEGADEIAIYTVAAAQLLAASALVIVFVARLASAPNAAPVISEPEPATPE